MAKVIGFHWTIEWGNPYTEPPNGIRVLAEKFVLHHGTEGARTPEDLASLHVLGSGYWITCRAVCEAIKPMSNETKASIRQKRLESRIRKKYPLFAEQLIAEAIQRKPKYYLEGVSKEDEAREQMLKAEDEEHRRLIANAGKLIIYGRLEP